jgi:hypothetical protein
MAQIELLLGNTAKSTNYSVRSDLHPPCILLDVVAQSIATSYVTQWQKFATSTTGAHLTLSVSLMTLFYRAIAYIF